MAWHYYDNIIYLFNFIFIITDLYVFYFIFKYFFIFKNNSIIYQIEYKNVTNIYLKYYKYFIFVFLGISTILYGLLNIYYVKSIPINIFNILYIITIISLFIFYEIATKYFINMTDKIVYIFSYYGFGSKKSFYKFSKINHYILKKNSIYLKYDSYFKNYFEIKFISNEELQKIEEILKSKGIKKLEENTSNQININ